MTNTLKSRVRIKPITDAHSRRAGERMVLLINDVEVAFRWIPPGRFTAGSPRDEEGRFNDETLHDVILTQSYWLAETPTTQRLWKAVTGRNPSEFKGDDRPVEKVSWRSCVNFIGRLNSMFRTLGRYFRLPTEAEWERACRAGAKCERRVELYRLAWDYSVSVPNLEQLAWYNRNSGGQTHPVASKEPNAWGLYDMLGNVWEWCADWYGEYPSGTVTDPTGPRYGSNRVLRGGSWRSISWLCRPANRDYCVPTQHLCNNGFRLLLTDER